MTLEGHQLQNALALAQKRQSQLQAVEHFLNLTAKAPREGLIFESLVKVLVHDLKWDSAVVIQTEGWVRVQASFHLTEAQHRSLNGSHSLIGKLLGHTSTIATFARDDVISLALRTTFHTDEVAGVPLTINGRHFGFILVCAHTTRNRHRSYADVDFLQTLAKLAVTQVEQCRTIARLRHSK